VIPGVSRTEPRLRARFGIGEVPAALDSQAIEIIPDPVVHLTRDGAVGYGNPAWCALASAVGVNPQAVADALPKGVIDHLLAQVAPTGECDLHDVEVAGRNFTLRARGVGARSDVFVFFRETTEARRLRDCLMQADRLAQIGQLAAGVGHEINNPAAFIRANLGALDRYMRALMVYVANLEARLAEASIEPVESAALEAERRKLGIQGILEDVTSLISDSLGGIERIRTTVADLRSFVRPDGDPEDCLDVHEAIDAAIGLARHEIRGRVQIERHYGGHALVHGVARRLSQVFLNLLTNAAQAMEQPGTIRIRTRIDGDMVDVAISDEGRGICPMVQARLFEPFVTTQPPGLGTGLGLFVCHNIVRQHGGEIDLVAGAERGTTARVRLPLQTKGAD